MDGFGYGVLLSLGVLMFTIIITLVSYCCTLMRMPAPPANPSHHRVNTTTIITDQGLSNMEQGLGEATVHSYPKLLYSQAKLQKGDSIASSCSICLGDYKDTEMLRMLPDCGHIFHLKCVDPWLRMHPSCPICRNSPIPTPLSTPLAEVTPLAARRD
ncbi:hypothetical protein RGQ29_017544 [Quercus rubra]|uniref:RING-type E3 ubiquitin transferase n=1 Tax=Quercus rubra TaxID=3512 RepID=A0AAN7J0M4_QUERU|nr:hypothetical protein RGQ29_017544 [Quercus rubra]